MVQSSLKTVAIYILDITSLCHTLDLTQQCTRSIYFFSSGAFGEFLATVWREIHVSILARGHRRRSGGCSRLTGTQLFWMAPAHLHVPFPSWDDSLGYWLSGIHEIQLPFPPFHTFTGTSQDGFLLILKFFLQLGKQTSTYCKFNESALNWLGHLLKFRYNVCGLSLCKVMEFFKRH